MTGSPLAHVTVVLVRPRQPGNVGVAARAIANHGLGGMAVVSPRGFDPERARWMAPGAEAVVDGARYAATVEEAVAGARLVVGTTGRARRWRWPVLDPGGLAEAVLGDPAPVSLLFGPEDKGLSNEDLALCHNILCLPTAEHASLNLGQAVNVTAAGLLLAAIGAGAEPGRARQAPKRGSPDRWSASPPPDEPADALQQARVAAEAVAVLDSVGYLSGRSEEQVRGSLYRLLGRALPSRQELNFLSGMVKAVAYTLKARSG